MINSMKLFAVTDQNTILSLQVINHEAYESLSDHIMVETKLLNEKVSRSETMAHQSFFTRLFIGKNLEPKLNNIFKTMEEAKEFAIDNTDSEISSLLLKLDILKAKKAKLYEINEINT
jgi:hypothetical protein